MNYKKIKIMKREISGLGGRYEKECRNMLIAGLRWLDENPNANPVFKGHQNIYGVINEENEDAEKLSNIVVQECQDCSGAAHQAVIMSVLWIKKNGIEKYLEEMNK